MLKISLDKDIKINYPSLLIIDTMKDEVVSLVSKMMIEIG